MIIAAPTDGMPVREFLEDLRNAVNRSGNVTGDDKWIDVSDEAWGKQISFREENTDVELVMMVLKEVKEDYLDCRQVQIIVGSQGGPSANKITSVLVSKLATYVAKPWHLRKTPWEGEQNEDGETITYATDDDGKAIMDERIVEKSDVVLGSFGKKTERISPEYGSHETKDNVAKAINIIVGEVVDKLPEDSTKWPPLILASQPDGGTGAEVVIDDEPLVLTWQDINMDGRHWDIPNIIPNFPSSSEGCDLFDIRLHVSPTSYGLDDEGSVEPYKGTDRKDDSGTVLNNGWDTTEGGVFDLAAGTEDENDLYEGHEEPDEHMWKVDEQPPTRAGLKIPFVTRIAYKDEGDEELYGYARMLFFDVTGRLHAVGRETRFIIDTPVEC